MPRRGLDRVAAAKLDRLVEEALVDAYGEEEQRTAFYTMLEEHLAMPFKTEVLGVEVTVRRIDLTDDDQIVAVCTRGRLRQEHTRKPARLNRLKEAGPLAE